MFDTALRILLTGLSLWSHKDSNKYRDKALKLQKDYYAEYNKGPDVRSDAVLDNLAFELRILGDSFAAAVGKQNP